MEKITVKGKSPSQREAVSGTAMGSDAEDVGGGRGWRGSLTCEAGSCRRIEAVTAVSTVTAGDLII